MSYCINPNCSNRHNSDDLEYCQTCGTKLLINERYQIVKPLRVGLAYNSEVCEVQDLNEQRTSKVLKSLAAKHNNTKLAELFEKEARILIWLSSVWHRHPGIPQVNPDGYFEFGIGNGCRRLQCLVLEKIEGLNLEEWIEENQPISQEQALNWLQQLLDILDKVHRQGLWHRDIKPSNIMLKPDGQLVLIDFGAVGVGETRIVSADYTPKEQIEGRTVLQSDFFALGRTFVYLLTGRHPREFPKTSTTEQLIWRNLAPAISSNLVQLIDDLMAPESANRPQNTQEIWRRIQAIDNRCSSINPVHQTTSLSNFNTNEITQFPSNCTNKSRIFSVKLSWLGGVTLLLGLALFLIYKVLSCEILRTFKPCVAAFSDKLSFGEKILIPGSATLEKERGVEAFRDGKYGTAVDWLEKARSIQKSDPETLIYLNNAKIQVQKAKFYTIAVAVPLDTSSEGLNSGLEILRGVAQAQDELNQRRNRANIKVLIADDANKSAQAKQIAKALVNQKDVLAVVGHFTSDSTIAASEVYQQSQLVFISPTSTSEDLSAEGKSNHPNFFFRTVPSDRITAQTLANYLSQQSNRQSAAVFYNLGSTYSTSLFNEFRNSFSAIGGKVVDKLDLSTPIINTRQAIDKAGQQGAKVIALFPNSESRIINKTKNLINANQCHHFMVGGDSVYIPEILELGRAAANCLVVAVPWDRMDSPDKEFPQAAEKLWAGQVNWRTASAYDATRVLSQAITKSKLSRISVQQVLATPNFQVTGATGTIQFRSNGDRNEANMKLIKLVVDKQGNPKFVPLP